VRYAWFVSGPWIAWAIYWQVSARNTKPTRRRESFASRASHIVPLVLGIALIAVPDFPAGWLSRHMLPPAWTTYWSGVAMLVAGLCFTVWARVHLGANWSGTVTLKEDHELVRTGPYGWVRHPIYTGLLLAILGSAVARNEWRALAGFVLAAASLIRKLRIEERWMRETFGERYEAYARDVRALVPLIF
jgi:protein-S-isoprenylcysteine O-methyltransferase Ste14